MRPPPSDPNIPYNYNEAVKELQSKVNSFTNDTEEIKRMIKKHEPQLIDLTKDGEGGSKDNAIHIKSEEPTPERPKTRKDGGRDDVIHINSDSEEPTPERPEEKISASDPKTSRELEKCRDSEKNLRKEIEDLREHSKGWQVHAAHLKKLADDCLKEHPPKTAQPPAPFHLTGNRLIQFPDLPMSFLERSWNYWLPWYITWNDVTPRGEEYSPEVGRLLANDFSTWFANVIQAITTIKTSQETYLKTYFYKKLQISCEDFDSNLQELPAHDRRLFFNSLHHIRHLYNIAIQDKVWGTLRRLPPVEGYWNVADPFNDNVPLGRLVVEIVRKEFRDALRDARSQITNLQQENAASSAKIVTLQRQYLEEVQNSLQANVGKTETQNLKQQLEEAQSQLQQYAEEIADLNNQLKEGGKRNIYGNFINDRATIFREASSKNELALKQANKELNAMKLYNQKCLESVKQSEQVREEATSRAKDLEEQITKLRAEEKKLKREAEEATERRLKAMDAVRNCTKEIDNLEKVIADLKDTGKVALLEKNIKELEDQNDDLKNRLKGCGDKKRALIERISELKEGNIKEQDQIKDPKKRLGACGKELRVLILTQKHTELEKENTKELGDHIKDLKNKLEGCDAEKGKLGQRITELEDQNAKLKSPKRSKSPRRSESPRRSIRLSEKKKKGDEKTPVNKGETTETPKWGRVTDGGGDSGDDGTGGKRGKKRKADDDNPETPQETRGKRGRLKKDDDDNAKTPKDKKTGPPQYLGVAKEGKIERQSRVELKAGDSINVVLNIDILPRSSLNNARSC